MTRENIRNFIGANLYGKIRAKPKKISRPKSVSDKIALITATCGGIGYLPLVPATWGSLFGAGIYFLTIEAVEKLSVMNGNFLTGAVFSSFFTSIVCILLILLFLIGIWSANRVEKLTGEKDPSIVVIDEVVGQLITFLFIPARLGIWTVIAGFLLFRFFDIFKPYPAGKLESLPSGLGAMADDAMAGFYAAAVLSALGTVYLFFY